jgi:hypothetical protein
MGAQRVLRGTITAVMILLGLAFIVGSGAATETEALLVVDGKIAGGKPAAFDLALLKSLPAVTVTTMTPWTDGEIAFQGVRLRDLLEHLGAKGDAVVAAAVDDYQATIPIEDFRDYDVIVAYAMNGVAMTPDNKGPLWIVYPLSGHPGLQKDLYYSRSVWQLNRLTVQ